jgi:peptide/nickel transport system substrate-binding protein
LAVTCRKPPAYEEGNPWRGKPTFQIKYDPDTARKLMSEAGYSESKPLHVTVATSASGSGQMQPLPMNEYIQQSLKSCFFNVDIKVNEWNTLFTNWRLGRKILRAGRECHQRKRGGDRPYFGMIRFATEKAFPPTATNWGYFTTPETEKLATAVKHAFTPAEMDKAAGELHAALVDQAPFLFVAHDVGPRAISRRSRVSCSHRAGLST